MSGESEKLVERANAVRERMLELEDTPYFSGGRGPSPVHEIRSVIEDLLATIDTLTAERTRMREALEVGKERAEKLIARAEEIIEQATKPEPANHAAGWIYAAEEILAALKGDSDRAALNRGEVG